MTRKSSRVDDVGGDLTAFPSSGRAPPSSVQGPATAVASAGFWIFDDSLVALETPAASIEVTRPQETGLYARMFEHLRGRRVRRPRGP